MALFDNRIVQIVVVIVAFYVLAQIMTKSLNKENLEVIQGPSVVMEPTPLIIQQGIPSASSVSNLTASSSQIPFIQPKPDVVVATSAPPVEITPLPIVQDVGQVPAPYDPYMFHPNEIKPSDLLPQEEPELFKELPADSSLDQNFLTSSWQYGIQTSAPRRNQNQDIRKLPPVPMKNITPFNNATILPDFTRKSLADLE